MNATRVISSLFVLLVMGSSAFVASASAVIAARTSNSSPAAFCPPGSYKFTEDDHTVVCQVCPPGTYSDAPNSNFCKLCLDTMYDGEGANYAELWNGELYCLHWGLEGDDFLVYDDDDVLK